MNRLQARLNRKLRLSKPFGHFFKWYLGDGEHCPWCKLCRRFPVATKVIPYSYYGTYFCQECGYHYDKGPNDERWAYPTCPDCGGKCV